MCVNDNVCVCVCARARARAHYCTFVQFIACSNTFVHFLDGRSLGLSFKAFSSKT